MTAISRIEATRRAGFLIGVALAVSLVLASRPATGHPAVGAAVSAYANQTGELAVDPAGPSDFLDASELRPGSSTSGSFRVTNQTGRPRAITVAAVPSSHELDHALRVAIRSGARTLAAGDLGSLGEGGGDPLVLAPGERATVSLAVSLSPEAGVDPAAAMVEIAVVLETEEPATKLWLFSG